MIDTKWMKPYGCYQTAEGLWVRDKGEEGVREQQKEWKGLIEVFKDTPCQQVWDLGAHVGWFTWFANQNLHPNPEILCVECSPRQIELLQYNIPSNARLLQGALVPDSYRGSGVTLWLGKKYSSCDTIQPAKNRRGIYGIRAIKLRDVIKAMPNPDAIKLDIEGSEYGLDWQNQMPKSVKCLVAELHHPTVIQQVLQSKFQQIMIELGFKPVRPAKINTFQKVCHVRYDRI